MPYVQRNADGRITSLHREAPGGTAEELPLDHPDVLAFLDASPRAGDEFARLDASFVRVIEDLIDTLIAKNLINLTDLPEQAQSKLLSRKTFRERAARDALKLFGDGGDGLIRTPPESSSG
jgi:hypothetical protein